MAVNAARTTITTTTRTREVGDETYIGFRDRAPGRMRLGFRRQQRHRKQPAEPVRSRSGGGSARSGGEVGVRREVRRPWGEGEFPTGGGRGVPGQPGGAGPPPPS